MSLEVSIALGGPFDSFILLHGLRVILAIRPNLAGKYSAYDLVQSYVQLMTEDDIQCAVN
jgi:hypothetical protein